MKNSGIDNTIIAEILSGFRIPIALLIVCIMIAITIALIYLVRRLVSLIRKNKIENKEIATELLDDDSEFELIYSAVRKKHEVTLAKIRKGTIPLVILVALLGIFAGGIFVWMALAKINIGKYANFIVNNTTLIKILPIIAAALFFWVYFMLAFEKTRYSKKYKECVVSDVVNATEAGLVFSIHGGLAEQKLLQSYKKASFDSNYWNKCVSEDYIMGCVTDEIVLTMAEMYLDKVVDCGKNSRSVEVFRGLFAQTYGINGFKGMLKILNNNNKMKEKNVQNLTAVKMDSSEFESIFNVYAEDPILAMRVLTSDVMQKMVEFETRLGIHYELVINGRELFVRFFTKTLFEASIYNEKKEKYRLRQCYEIINLIKDISIEINKTLSEIEA